MTVSRDTRRRVEYTLGYIGLGMFEQAKAELAGIGTAERSLPVVRSAWIDCHLAAKQWDKAVAVARALAEEYPQIENAWIGWAYALRELQQVSEAREVLLSAEEHHGKTSAVLHYNLACYEALLGFLARAKVRLRRACKMDQQFKLAAQEDPDLVALREAGTVEGEKAEG